MAIKFGKTFNNAILFRLAHYVTTMNSAFAITVWGGSQPTADDVQDNWASYNSNYLIHFTGVKLRTNGGTDTTGNGTVGGDKYLELINVPSGVAAAATGNATWGIMWGNNCTTTTLSGGTVANSRFIVCPVTSLNGNGVVKIEEAANISGNVVLTSGSTYNIADVLLYSTFTANTLT